MDVKNIILKELEKQGVITSLDLQNKLGLTRQTLNYHLQSLLSEKLIQKVGSTRGTHYILNKPSAIEKHIGVIAVKKDDLVNKTLDEDLVLGEIKRSTIIFNGLKENIAHILSYAFTEMLNNAIEHSNSEKIFYEIKRSGNELTFEIKDSGVGIFTNIENKFGLSNELEAIQELVKGKSTTDPKHHSGEGIFFTSKIADELILSSHKTKLIFDNKQDDIAVGDIRSIQGTRVEFSIGTDSKKDLQKLFEEFSTNAMEFDKTRVRVSLFAGGVEYISRSQARRLMINLDKYNVIELDFKGINSIGQGFADQVFRVFQGDHPEIVIKALNCIPVVDFMIARSKNADQKK